MSKPLTLLLLIAVACSQPTADEASSWLATLQFTGEKWLANSVPSSFARATIDSADKALAKVSDPKVGREVSEARADAQSMRQAIAKNDRREVARLVRRFAALQHTQ